MKLSKVISTFLVLSFILSIAVSSGKIIISSAEEVSNNLLNKAEVKSNQYAADEGSNPDSKFCVTGYIAVNPGDVISIAPASKKMKIAYAVFYDADNKAVSSVKSDGINVLEPCFYDYSIISVTVPKGAVSVRFNIYSNLLDMTAIAKGKMTFADYASLNKLDMSKFHFDTKLNGKSALFCGDSITAATVYDKTKLPITGWAGRIGYYYGINVTNKGVDGASVSTVRGSNRIITQVKSVRDIDYDLVILHGGVNDAWDSAKVGKMSDSRKVEDFDTSTYAGGLEELFYYAKQYFGDKAVIGYIFNFKFDSRNGNIKSTGKLADMSEYYAVAKQICEKWEIPYLDLYDDEDMFKAITGRSGTNLGDKSIHPNEKGYEILYPAIEKWMETLIPDPVIDDKNSGAVNSGKNSGDAVDTIKDNILPDENNKEKDNKLIWIISGITAALAVCGTAVYFIVKKKKKKSAE